VLVGALGQEVVANSGAVQEETVPGLAKGRDDALVALDAYFDLVDTLREAHVQRESDSLGAIVDENSADSHAYLPTRMYVAIVYRAVHAVNLALPRVLYSCLIKTMNP
jgi:hypothetical protein